MTKKKVIPHEDKTIIVKGKEDTIKCQDEFLNGDCICICQECGTKFIGSEESYFCIVCLNEFY